MKFKEVFTAAALAVGASACGPQSEVLAGKAMINVTNELSACGCQIQGSPERVDPEVENNRGWTEARIEDAYDDRVALSVEAVCPGEAYACGENALRLPALSQRGCNIGIDHKSGGVQEWTVTCE